jgi:hypothetical protein
MFDAHGQNCRVIKFRAAGSSSPEKVKKVLLIAKASRMSQGPIQPSVQAVNVVVSRKVIRELQKL